jgi:lysophospholipase L1-like esterase
MINLKGLRTNALIIIFSLVIVSLFIEFVIHFIYDEKNNKPFLFITKPSLLDQYKSFGYSKNTHVREIAVYGDGRNFHIEYDISFVTNNIGLVQKKPFYQKKKSIVIIGDSFTQGSGATPWFYQLEDDWENNEYQLINLGIIGTGIEQWKDTLRWFSGIGEIKHIFICCISDDWIRPRWYVCENMEQNALALSNSVGNNFQTGQDQPIIYILIYFIEKDSDHYTILKRAKDIAISYDVEIKEFLKKFILTRIVQRVLRKYDTLYHNHNEIAFSKNKISFDQIISAYGAKHITVLHIPQKDEVIQGEYNELGKKVKSFILSRHIPYIDGLALCKLNKSDFYRDDSHPNAAGYKKIYDYVSKNALENLRFE